MTNTAYGVRAVSHWQGSQPGRVLAAVATQLDAEKLVDKISTCSFCTPGRSSQYHVGSCYEVVRTSRQPGYLTEDAPEELVEAMTGLAS